MAGGNAVATLFCVPFIVGWVGFGLFLSRLADKRAAVHDQCYVSKSSYKEARCSCCGSGCGCLRAVTHYHPFPGTVQGYGTDAVYANGDKPGWPTTKPPTAPPTPKPHDGERHLTQEEAWALPPPPKGKGSDPTAKEEGSRLLAATRRRLLTSRRPATDAIRGRGRELKKSSSSKKCTTYYFDCYYPQYHLDYGEQTGDPTKRHGRAHSGTVTDDKTAFCYAWWAQFVAHPTHTEATCWWDRRTPSTVRMYQPNPTGCPSRFCRNTFSDRNALHLHSYGLGCSFLRSALRFN